MVTKLGSGSKGSMLTFKEFMAVQPNIDESQIDSLYNKAHIAVQLARTYAQRSDRPDLFKDVAVIGNLASGAYGIYNSSENKKILPKNIEQSLIYYGRVNKNNINNIPKKTIKQYYPQVPEDQIKDSDTIHVNIRRILQEFPDDLDRIIEVAATILHEAQHAWERENLGYTNETGPINREKHFKDWVYNKDGKNILQQLLAKTPQQQKPLMAPGLPSQQQSPNPTTPLLSTPYGNPPTKSF